MLCFANKFLMYLIENLVVAIKKNIAIYFFVIFFDLKND